MSLNSLIKLNGIEITEHGRKMSNNISFENIDIELASGDKRRFYKDTDRIFQFSWTYLPDKSNMSADGKAARDYIKSIVESGANVVLEIKENRDIEWKTYSCLIVEYSETLLKHVLQSQCRYYDLSLSLESL